MPFSSRSSNQRPSARSAIMRASQSRWQRIAQGQAGDPVTVAQAGISSLAHCSWPPSPLTRRHHVPSDALVLAC
ncbi:hypothetical protein PSPO01_11843 [Paraphaeosphaeria sporulosa]